MNNAHQKNRRPSTKPKKSLGQNFLTDISIAADIVESAAVSDESLVIEIGPGRGILTALIVPHCKNLWAVELDDRLIGKLEGTFEQYKNIEIVHKDILHCTIPELTGSDKMASVIGNIPYHITSSILFWALRQARFIDRMILMMQKEVAERIICPPGKSNRGILSPLVQYQADAEILFDVPNHSFFPVPKVTSSVLSLQFKEPEYPVDDFEKLIGLVKACFSQKRKKLKNSIKGLYKDKIDFLIENFDLNRRVEELGPKDFAELYALVYHGHAGSAPDASE